MSVRLDEFPEVGAGAGESRANRPDRHGERNRRLLVVEPGPGAERQNVALVSEELLDDGLDLGHLRLVGDAADRLVAVVGLDLTRVEPPERGRSPAPAPSPVPQLVRRNSEEPGQNAPRLGREDDLAAASPGGQEDVGRGILRRCPVRRRAEREVVDGAGVTFEESAERAGIAVDGRSPELPIGGSHYFVHVRTHPSVPDRHDGAEDTPAESESRPGALLRSGAPMPIYEYVCMECESHFEELVRGEQQVACPDCAATNVSRQFSSFAVHEQLQAELAELEGPKRQEAIEAIATARAHGDLSENFEYHAAKNEQGLLEARIRVLRHRLQHATIVDEEAAAASGVVTVGSRVELEREDGTRQELEITSVGGVSPESPVGRALLGKAPGDEIEVEAPRGRWKARIVSVGRAS
jgi:transcription elongation factor GreA